MVAGTAGSPPCSPGIYILVSFQAWWTAMMELLVLWIPRTPNKTMEGRFCLPARGHELLEDVMLVALVLDARLDIMNARCIAVALLCHALHSLNLVFSPKVLTAVDI